MQERYFTDDKNTLILIALLKAHGIRKIIASPGTTNIALVASIMRDPWFEIYSSVDERSACYIACGMAAESGEPVVLSCTGATASRNYFAGLTEAYYRKLPILAITGSHGEDYHGHLHAQDIDRSQAPKDTVLFSTSIKLKDTEWKATIEINKAILALTHRGGGPVHMNLESAAYGTFNTKNLPIVRKIMRYTAEDELPKLNAKRVVVYIGSHPKFTDDETFAIDSFCKANNAVVVCDHTSGYNGAYKVLFALPSCQTYKHKGFLKPDVVVHIGEVTGEFYSKGWITGKETWRVSRDGEIRDFFDNLANIFEMSEKTFFSHYTCMSEGFDEYYKTCKSIYDEIFAMIPELPFGNIWMAHQLHTRIPNDSNLHFSIFNSLRSWNFFELNSSITTSCNVGGFGIDGPISTIIGSSLINTKKLHFLVIGDLAFFYDLNSLGNRHIGKNLRILLINNGCGTEFRNFDHPASKWGEEADLFMAAGGHFGSQSTELVKHYVSDLGFEYISASNKEEFNNNIEKFVCSDSKSPIVFEVFTTSNKESDAIRIMRNLVPDNRSLTEIAVQEAKIGAKAIIRKISRL